jgi:PAS domain S-box-containing protein
MILGPDLQILDASDEYLKASLTVRSDIQGKYLFDVFPDNPDDHNATGTTNLKASLNRVLQNKTADAMAVQKYDIRNSDGQYIERSWSPFNVPVFDSNGEILYIIHKAEDVTNLLEEKERHIVQNNLIADLKEQLKALDIYKRAQQIQDVNISLRESVKEQSAAFETLFNAVPVGVIGIDHAGIIKFFNEKACQMFNYEVEDILHRPIDQIIHCSGFNLSANLLEMIQDKDDADITKKLDLNCFGIRNGGSEFPFELNISETQFNGAKIHLLSIKDISTEKAALAQQKEHIKQMEEKNRELEQFTYIASHDLQEPLRSITSFIELFQQEYQGVFDENAQTYFDFVLQSTGRMKELIKGLLDYSRIGKQMIIRKEDCNEILRQVVHDLNNSIDRSKATVNIDPLPSIYASGLHLRILFQNLIANSLKFNKPGIPPVIHISVEQNKTHWQFCIKDNGIGMDIKYQDKIFTIFQRLHTKDTYEGTGIGLAHCKKIVQLHDGKIWFESKPGEGTEFYFTISKNI